jgi:hypothetical protein
MKQLTAFFLVFSLLFVSMPQKSHAVVGVVIRDKTTRTIGAIVTAVSGVTATATIYALGATGAYFSGAAALILLSVPGVAIGLIILDEKNADLKFKPLTQDNARLLGLTEEELDVYNSEVDELNLIKAEVEEQVSENVTDEEIAQLWTEYGKSLSPETMTVAAKVITKTYEAKNK